MNVLPYPLGFRDTAACKSKPPHGHHHRGRGRFNAEPLFPGRRETHQPATCPTPSEPGAFKIHTNQHTLTLLVAKRYLFQKRQAPFLARSQIQKTHALVSHGTAACKSKPPHDPPAINPRKVRLGPFLLHMTHQPATCPTPSELGAFKIHTNQHMVSSL